MVINLILNDGAVKRAASSYNILNGPGGNQVVGPDAVSRRAVTATSTR
jgi:hypothetical protein